MGKENASQWKISDLLWFLAVCLEEAYKTDSSLAKGLQIKTIICSKASTGAQRVKPQLGIHTAYTAVPA